MLVSWPTMALIAHQKSSFLANVALKAFIWCINGVYCVISDIFLDILTLIESTLVRVKTASVM